MTGEVTLSDTGFEVEAALIASAFGLDPASVPDLMRAGAITSRCETGVGEDEGRWRLTFFHKGRALRLTVDATGAILLRATFDVGGRGSRLAGGQAAVSVQASAEAGDEQAPT